MSRIENIQSRLAEIDKSKLSRGKQIALTTIKQGLRNIQQDCKEIGYSSTSSKFLDDAENFANKYGKKSVIRFGDGTCLCDKHLAEQHPDKPEPENGWMHDMCTECVK